MEKSEMHIIGIVFGAVCLLYSTLWLLGALVIYLDEKLRFGTKTFRTAKEKELERRRKLGYDR
jgi:hypothetical protein